MPRPLAVAVLQEMWGPSKDGKAPRAFTINPQNLTGRRLYRWLADEWRLLVTNACPQIVANARGRGTPDPAWLAGNLREIERMTAIDLLLICGKVAEQTYLETGLNGYGARRVIVMPHPAARTWTAASLSYAGRLIREGSSSLRIELRKGRLAARRLDMMDSLPF